MASTFSRLHPRLQEAIVHRLGWTRLRPVQEQAGAALLDGDNAVVLAPTAGGKTEAAMFPALSSLLSEPTEGVGVLYIAPIKALLNNQAERLGRYTQMVALDRTVWHGDVGPGPRKRFLAEPTELLMTTPESLEVMLISPKVDATRLFADLRMVVIDEIHALAGSDRGGHLMSVLERLNALSRHDLQRVGLSATVGNPDAILRWLGGTSTRPGRVVDPPSVPARRRLLVVHRPDLNSLSLDAARLARGQKSLLFCQSRAVTEAAADTMRAAGTDVFVHHSAVSKEERELAEANFHRGRDACIVCTSTLELGIDVGDLDAVLQAEAPDTVGSFLQRMGRTGRRSGQVANTTFLCTTGWSVVQALALIALAREGWVEQVAVRERCWPVLVHQLFAMSLARSGVTAEAAWAHLSRVPDLRGIHRAEFDRLLHHLVRDRSLDLVDGRLLLGPKAERRFGRRNFMDLYAIFSSPATYRVETAHGQPIGTLQQAFVDQLVEGQSSFLLGGRGWQPARIDHGKRTIVAATASWGKMPTWGGAAPQFLGFELCQAMRGILADTGPVPFLHDSAKDVLAEMREGFAGLADGDRDALEDAGDSVLWWTFAGGRINATLVRALRALQGGWKITSDNFRLKIVADDLGIPEVRPVVRRLSEVDVWEDEALWSEIATDLPGFRLSKFQDVLPPWVVQEMVADFLLDVEGAWRWASGDAAADAPAGSRALRQTDPARDAPPPALLAPDFARPTRPIRWIRDEDALHALCAELRREDRVALDVETTLRTRSLCLVQLGTASFNALIDPLAVDDLAPLAALLEDPRVVKIIHNASFEKSVLGRMGMEIHGVLDTLELSRRKHGRGASGGHSLAAVVQRELGRDLDKTEQTSRWDRRPLTPDQEAYAALDVEVLVDLVGPLGETGQVGLV